MRPTQTPVGREPLLAELLGRCSVVERLLPVAGEPLDLAQRPEDQSARPLVASCQRLPLQLLGHHARSLDLAQTGHQSGERHAWARLIVERKPEALLHLHAPLEQARCDLGRPRLHLAHPCDRARDELGIANVLGLLQSHAGIDECRRVRRTSASGSTLEWPGSVTSAHRRGRPRRGPRRRARASSEGRPVKVLTSSRSTSDRSTPDGTSVSSCSRIAAAISPLPARRWYVAARMRRCRASAGSSGVSSAASSQSSAAAGGAPRAAACSAAVSSSEAIERRGPLRRAPDGGPAPRSPSPPLRACDARHGASRPAPAHRQTRRATDAQSERASRRARRCLRRTAASSASSTRSRSPYAAVTSSTVGRASAAAWSKTSPVWVGRRSRRPPSSSRRLSGTRKACPGVGLVFVRTSSRPSSSAKNGIARRRLLHAGELWSGQLEPEPLLEQTMQRAERERAEREPLQPLVREEAVELEAALRPRAPA